MNTNEIISYDISKSPNLEQITRMLDKAFEKFPKLNGLIFHSDQGWQYQHNYYRTALKEHGIIQSMSRKGNCYDNSVMENFFGLLKQEVYYGITYYSFDELKETIEKYIVYYNEKRIKEKLGWMSPVEYRLSAMAA